VAHFDAYLCGGYIFLESKSFYSFVMILWNFLFLEHFINVGIFLIFTVETFIRTKNRTKYEMECFVTSLNEAVFK
jgi:hypothetical protein